MTENKKRIANRAEAIADYIIVSEGTVRKAADRFGVSKATVYKDLTERLPGISKSKAKIVKVILKHNKALSHIRGGYAYKKIWEQRKAV